jgi:hypothetical protein
MQHRQQVTGVRALAARVVCRTACSKTGVTTIGFPVAHAKSEAAPFSPFLPVEVAAAPPRKSVSVSAGNCTPSGDTVKTGSLTGKMQQRLMRTPRHKGFETQFDVVRSIETQSGPVVQWRLVSTNDSQMALIATFRLSSMTRHLDLIKLRLPACGNRSTIRPDRSRPYFSSPAISASLTAIALGRLPEAGKKK